MPFLGILTFSLLTHWLKDKLTASEGRMSDNQLTTQSTPTTDLPDVEKGILITYNVINTFLIIVFNSLVIGIIAFSKVSYFSSWEAQKIFQKFER